METREKIKLLYEKYELSKEDVFKHKHYLILTRSGIDKIQAIEKMVINYEVIVCKETFAVVKASTDSLQTFGSALKGDTYDKGNTNSWYVMEMAEKRAMSRIVLKTTGFYELGFFSEDESDEFKKQ